MYQDMKLMYHVMKLMYHVMVHKFHDMVHRNRYGIMTRCYRLAYFLA